MGYEPGGPPQTPYEPPSAAPLLGQVRAEALEAVAGKIGLYCAVCGGEMSGPGFEFVALIAVMKEGHPHVEVSRTFICHRDECAAAREEGRLKATAVRPAGGWTILSAGGESFGEHDEHGD